MELSRTARAARAVRGKSQRTHVPPLPRRTRRLTSFEPGIAEVALARIGGPSKGRSSTNAIASGDAQPLQRRLARLLKETPRQSAGAHRDRFRHPAKGERLAKIFPKPFHQGLQTTSNRIVVGAIEILHLAAFAHESDKGEPGRSSSGLRHSAASEMINAGIDLYTVGSPPLTASRSRGPFPAFANSQFR